MTNNNLKINKTGLASDRGLIGDRCEMPDLYGNLVFCPFWILLLWVVKYWLWKAKIGVLRLIDPRQAKVLKSVSDDFLMPITNSLSLFDVFSCFFNFVFPSSFSISWFEGFVFYSLVTFRGGWYLNWLGGMCRAFEVSTVGRAEIDAILRHSLVAAAGNGLWKNGFKAIRAFFFVWCV